MNDLFLGQQTEAPGPAEPAQSRRARNGDAARRQRARRQRTLVVVTVALLLVGGAGFVVWSVVDGWLGGQQTADDHPGPGHGQVEIVVATGDTGAAIGRTLVDAGVVKSTAAFNRAYQANSAATSIQPGAYLLRYEMSAADAVAALLDPSFRVAEDKVTIPEGLRLSQILERIASVTGISREDLDAAVADPAAIGLPAEAGGVVEGWLFPATYEFDGTTTAVSLLQTMVAKTVQVLDARGVPAEGRQELLIRASLVEKEARTTEDRAMVARAIQNRLDIEMKLDIDAALAYGLDKPGTELTRADKEIDTPFNLYMHIGLPPHPIASPGEVSIDAVLNPADGPWKFWVTINLDTGETRFAETLAEHEQNVALLRQWQQENG